MKSFTLLAITLAGQAFSLAAPPIKVDAFHPENTQAKNEFNTAQLARRDGAQCNDYKIDSRNRQAAIDNLLHICGDGWGIDAKALTAQVDGTFAYICNYSGTNWLCRERDIRSLFDAIKTSCGEDGAGFYVQDGWHVNFGVADTGRGIC
ncbi:hypothetical protein PWT90_11096 [Aphanocladium album]|nr:hypothetical protein PWT90_11096 [Aphanocladium album]